MVCSCALLLVGTYILFDILDVDGSDLLKRIFHDPFVAYAGAAEAKRVLQQGGAVVSAEHLATHKLSCVPFLVSPHPFALSTIFLLGARHPEVDLRLRIRRSVDAAPSETDDDLSPTRSRTRVASPISFHSCFRRMVGHT